MVKRTIAFFANSSHKLLPGCCMGKPLFRSLQPLLQVLQRCPTELLQVCSVRQRFPRCCGNSRGCRRALRAYQGAPELPQVPQALGTSPD